VLTLRRDDDVAARFERPSILPHVIDHPRCTVAEPTWCAHLQLANFVRQCAITALAVVVPAGILKDDGIETGVPLGIWVKSHVKLLRHTTFGWFNIQESLSHQQLWNRF
jgi:hypothetical protein